MKYFNFLLFREKGEKGDRYSKKVVSSSSFFVFFFSFFYCFSLIDRSIDRSYSSQEDLTCFFFFFPFDMNYFHSKLRLKEHCHVFFPFYSSLFFFYFVVIHSFIYLFLAAIFAPFSCSLSEKSIKRRLSSHSKSDASLSSLIILIIIIIIIIIIINHRHYYYHRYHRPPLKIFSFNSQLSLTFFNPPSSYIQQQIFTYYF